MHPTVPFRSLAAVWPDRPVTAGWLEARLASSRRGTWIRLRKHPYDDLIVPIVPRARTTAALDTVDCFFADPPFNLGKDYGTDVHDEHPEDHAVV
jgi:hypothetical protein